MSAREKLIKLCLEKYPGTTQKNAENVADQILKEERDKIKNESQSGIKSRIKKLAGIK